MPMRMAYTRLERSVQRELERACRLPVGAVGGRRGRVAGGRLNLKLKL